MLYGILQDTHVNEISNHMGSQWALFMPTQGDTSQAYESAKMLSPKTARRIL